MENSNIFRLNRNSFFVHKYNIIVKHCTVRKIIVRNSIFIARIYNFSVYFDAIVQSLCVFVLFLGLACFFTAFMQR